MHISSVVKNQDLNGSVILNLLCVVNAQLDESWCGENMVLPFNRLYLVEEGSGMLDIGYGAVEMKPGMAYLVPAGAPLRYRCHGYMKKIYLHFHLLGPDMYDLMEGSAHIGVVPFPEDLPQKLRAWGAGSSAADSLKIRKAFYDLLDLFLPQFAFDQKLLPNYSEHVKSTIGFIQENLSASLRVEDLAKRLFISRSGLSALFRREVGVSIGKYIDDQLMMAALLRISRTNDSIQTISRELGFTDQCYFARRFKQVHGVTPTEHRRRKLL